MWCSEVWPDFQWKESSACSYTVSTQPHTFAVSEGWCQNKYPACVDLCTWCRERTQQKVELINPDHTRMCLLKPGNLQYESTWGLIRTILSLNLNASAVQGLVQTENVILLSLTDAPAPTPRQKQPVYFKCICPMNLAWTSQCANERWVTMFQAKGRSWRHHDQTDSRDCEQAVKQDTLLSTSSETLSLMEVFSALLPVSQRLDFV